MGLINSLVIKCVNYSTTAQGHNVIVYDVNTRSVEQLVAAGAASAASPKEVAGQVTNYHTSLRCARVLMELLTTFIIFKFIIFHPEINRIHSSEIYQAKYLSTTKLSLDYP